MKKLQIVLPAAAILAILSVPVSAQPVLSAKSGTVSWAEGKVFLGDEALETSLTKFPDIKENVVLRTEEGRAEVLLTPGVVMHIGENSSFRMITKRLIDTRLELLTGSAVVNAVEVPKDTNITIVCQSGAVEIKSGHFRFDAEPARVKVFAGMADVQLGESHIVVSAGKMLSLSGTSASAEKFNKEDTDSLDNWARRRDEVMAMANISAAKSAYNSYASVGGSGVWAWNPYFGLYTYVPGSGRFCDPYYGFCYWSPYAVNRVFYQPPAPSMGGGGFGGWSAPSYSGMGSTSGGYSGTMAASSSSVSAAPAAAASAAPSAASSAGSSSAGHGSAGGGGRGR